MHGTPRVEGQRRDDNMGESMERKSQAACATSLQDTGSQCHIHPTGAFAKRMWVHRCGTDPDQLESHGGQSADVLADSLVHQRQARQNGSRLGLTASAPLCNLHPRGHEGGNQDGKATSP